MVKIRFSPDRKQILMILGAAVGFLGWLALFFIPMLGNWIQKQPQAQELRSQIGEARQKLNQSAQREKELKDLRLQYELTGAATAQQQLPDLLGGIGQAARTSGVRLEAVKPKVDIGQLIPGPSGYLELPLEVNAVAGFHQLGAFLDVLERSDRLIRVQEFKIRRDSKDIWNHQATFILQSYLLPGTKSEGA